LIGLPWRTVVRLRRKPASTQTAARDARSSKAARTHKPAMNGSASKSAATSSGIPTTCLLKKEKRRRH